MRILLSISTADNTQKNSRHVFYSVCYLDLTGTSPLPSPFFTTGWSVWKKFCKFWRPTQMPFVVLEINFAFIIDSKNHKNFRVERKEGGHSVQPPIFKWPLGMKTRWHFQQTAFQLNVKCMWRNLKHHKLLEHEALPHFLQKAIKAHVEFEYSF